MANTMTTKQAALALRKAARLVDEAARYRPNRSVSDTCRLLASTKRGVGVEKGDSQKEKRHMTNTYASYAASQQPHPPIGARIEIPVHYDLWMRGAQFGTVTSYRKGQEGVSAYVTVKMDHPQVRRRLKVWALDWAYVRVLSVGPYRPAV